MNSSSAVATDPGWRPALSWRILLYGLVPAVFVTRLAGDNSSFGIVRIRQYFLGFFVTKLYLTSVTRIVSRVQDIIDPPAWWWPVFISYSVVSLGLTLWSRSKPLDVNDESLLKKSYLASFMLGHSFALTPTMLGFVGTFIVGGMRSLLLGLGFSLLGFLVIAPTRASLKRRQDEVSRQGSTLSVLGTLTRE